MTSTDGPAPVAGDIPRVLLDCDPGHDDAVAIIVAARHSHLVGITTVAGNAPARADHIQRPRAPRPARRRRSDPLRERPAPRRRTGVGRLPYNVGTKLLTAWLTTLAGKPESLAGLVLMFQQEVARRLVAAPRSKEYGRLSVLTQWLTEAQILFDVPARAFVPPPKVTSAVVGLKPRPVPLHPARLEDLERVTAAAFGQRRKMLRQSLKPLAGARAAVLLAEAGIPETARAEELDIGAFCRLAQGWRAGLAG